MGIISMVGCNAIGKSTAARRYAKRYAGKLVVVSADTQLVFEGGKERRERLERYLGREETTSSGL